MKIESASQSVTSPRTNELSSPRDGDIVHMKENNSANEDEDDDMDNESNDKYSEIEDTYDDSPKHNKHDEGQAEQAAT